jgi:hypothetical protein
MLLLLITRMNLGLCIITWKYLKIFNIRIHWIIISVITFFEIGIYLNSCGVPQESRNNRRDQGWFPRQWPTFPQQRLGIKTHPLLHNSSQYPSNELFEASFAKQWTKLTLRQGVPYSVGVQDITVKLRKETVPPVWRRGRIPPPWPCES